MLLHDCGWREALLDVLEEISQIPHPMANTLLIEYAEIVKDLEESEWVRMSKHEHKWVVDMFDDNYPVICEICQNEREN